jgi:anti-sigma-K factor RskA
MTIPHDERPRLETLLTTQTPPAPPLPDDFTARLAERIDAGSADDASHATPRAWRLPVALAAAAAVLALVVSAWFAVTSTSRNPSPLVADGAGTGTRPPLLAALGSVDPNEPLRDEARLMVDDARRLTARLRVPALLGAEGRTP